MCHIPSWAVEMKTNREAKGLTQRQVTDKMEIAEKTYRMWERGKRKPNLATRKELNRILGHINWEVKA